MKQQFTEEVVYGGLSEDDKMKGQGQILYAENLDLTSNSDYYSVSQKADSGYVTTDEVTLIFDVDGDIFYCDKDNKISKDGVVVYTGETFVNFWTNSTYLYLLDNDNDVYRILLSNVGSADWTSYLGQTDSTITDSGESFIVGYEGVAYIATGNTIYEVDNSTGDVVAENTFIVESTIVGMSSLEDSLQVFTKNGKYYLRNKEPGGDVRTKDLGTKIGLVKNIGNINYVISGGAVYQLNGYRLEKILSDTYSDVLSSDKYNITAIKPGLLTHLEGIFYMGVKGASSVETPLDEFEYGYDSILSLGVKKTGMPIARNLFISKVDNLNITNITYLYTKANPLNSYGKVLAIGYKDFAGNFGMTTINLGDQGGNDLSDNGVIIYNTFDGGIKRAQKSMMRIKIRADIPTSSDAIYVCDVETDGTLSWHKGTQAASKIDNTMMSDDGYFYMETVFTFYNYNLALILENTNADNRNEGVKVYSVSYEYDVTRND